MWRNTQSGYGWVSIGLHWLMAFAVLALFGLGLYMTDLGYYDPWYNLGPYIHEGVGTLLSVLLLIRVLWVMLNPRPRFDTGMRAWEKSAARLAHWMLYLLMLAVILSGYLITTANGDPLNVFDWFQVPALIEEVERMEDTAGAFHWYLSLALVLLSAVHALAALKHHFIHRDRTLVRMLKADSQK